MVRPVVVPSSHGSDHFTTHNFKDISFSPQSTLPRPFSLVPCCFASANAGRHLKAQLGLVFLRRSHRISTDAAPVAWERPGTGWLKLNFDGASKYATGNASIGGVYRNHHGDFVLGYAERIGSATSSVAELAAAKRGLELALANGWLSVWMEGDAKEVVDALAMRPRSRSSVEDLKLVRNIRELIPRLNDFSASHIYRRGNKVADRLAKLGYRTSKPQVWQGAPPREILRLLRQDDDRNAVRRRK